MRTAPGTRRASRSRWLGQPQVLRLQRQQQFYNFAIDRLDEHQVDARQSTLLAALFVGVAGDRDEQAVLVTNIEA